MQRRVRPNAWYGLRTPATLRDERVWYEANAHGGRDFVILGAAQIAFSLAIARFGADPNSDAHVFANAAFLVIGTLLVAAVGMIRAARIARRTP